MTPLWIYGLQFFTAHLPLLFTALVFRPSSVLSNSLSLFLIHLFHAFTASSTSLTFPVILPLTQSFPLLRLPSYLHSTVHCKNHVQAAIPPGQSLGCSSCCTTACVRKLCTAEWHQPPALRITKLLPSLLGTGTDAATSWSPTLPLHTDMEDMTRVCQCTSHMCLMLSRTLASPLVSRSFTITVQPSFAHCSSMCPVCKDLWGRRLPWPFHTVLVIKAPTASSQDILSTLTGSCLTVLAQRLAEA